jgi:hypothetical protein
MKDILEAGKDKRSIDGHCQQHSRNTHSHDLCIHGIQPLFNYTSVVPTYTYNASQRESFRYRQANKNKIIDEIEQPILSRKTKRART